MYLYAHSNELEEVGVISLSGVGVKVDYDPHMEALFAVSNKPTYPTSIPLTDRHTSSRKSIPSNSSPHPTHTPFLYRTRKISSRGSPNSTLPGCNFIFLLSTKPSSILCMSLSSLHLIASATIIVAVFWKSIPWLSSFRPISLRCFLSDNTFIVSFRILV